MTFQRGDLVEYVKLYGPNIGNVGIVIRTEGTHVYVHWFVPNMNRWSKNEETPWDAENCRKLGHIEVK